MILAAGRGERMRPLTNTMPKPLLKAGSHALIEYQIKNLAQAGFREIVINHAYLGEMIEQTLACGTRYGLHITYSPEKTILETAGGIANALPLLTDNSGSQPFLVVNADIYCEFDYAVLFPVLKGMYEAGSNRLAHLIMVDNPSHHVAGDFVLIQDHVSLTGKQPLTFSGIGLYHPALFKDLLPGAPARLAPLIRGAIIAGKVTGEYFSGMWMDVGTPARLEQLHRYLSVKQR